MALQYVMLISFLKPEVLLFQNIYRAFKCFFLCLQFILATALCSESTELHPHQVHKLKPTSEHIPLLEWDGVGRIFARGGNPQVSGALNILLENCSCFEFISPKRSIRSHYFGFNRQLVQTLPVQYRPFKACGALSSYIDNLQHLWLLFPFYSFLWLQRHSVFFLRVNGNHCSGAQYTRGTSSS